MCGSLSRKLIMNLTHRVLEKVEFLGELFDGMVSVDGLINMSLNFWRQFHVRGQA